MMDILDRMASLIVENPTITGRELARKLDYAQEKSVYYWLNKAGYKGINDFKQLVLRGDYPLSQSRLPRFETGENTENAYRLQRIPLRSSLKSDEPTPRSADNTVYVPASSSISEHAFAITIDTNEYQPAIQPGDIVVIDPAACVESGDLILVEEETAGRYLRRVYGENPLLFIHPARPKHFQQVKDNTERVRILGKSMRIIRSL